MYLYHVLLVLIVTNFNFQFSFCAGTGTTKSQSKCPNNFTFNSETTFPYNTYSPINVDLKDSKPVYMECPFKMEAVDEQNITIIMINTGKMIKFTGTSGTEKLTFYGGNFVANYVFHGTFFYWSRNINQNCASIVDGQIAPLFLRVHYRNPKYATFEEALKHRDGLAICESQILVKSGATNSHFDEFYQYLKLISNYSQSVSARNIIFWRWFVPEPPTSNAYVYPGAYIDEDGKQYNCATVLTWAKGYQPVISTDQYNKFIQVKNFAGQYYENRLVPQEKGSRPLLQSYGDFSISF